MMDAALTQAIERGDAAAVDRLLASRPELAQARLDGRTALHMAVRHDRIEVAEVLIRHGVPIDARNDEGRTALHDAIEDGRCAFEAFLIERGALIDVCAAAILGKIDRLRELLAADPGAANDRTTGLSPLGWAAYGSRTDAAEELIRHGARMDDGELLCAAAVGQVEVGRLLLDRGVDPNAIDGEACGTALHAAASMRYSCDSTAFVRLLLERGADPSIRTLQGMTALEVADAGAERQRVALERGEAPELVRNFDGVARVLREWTGGD